MKTFITRSALLGIFGLSLFATEASAQVDREGFLIGFNVGASYLMDKNLVADGEDHNLGFSGQFYLGGSLTPEFSLMGLYDFHAGVEEVQGVDVTVNGFVGPVAQYSFVNRFWVRGGPGFTLTQREYSAFGVNVNRDRSGFGALVGAGVEVWQSGKFAMDVNFRTIPQWYKSEDGGFAITYAGGLGFTWC